MRILVTRLATSIVLLFVVSALTFLLMSLLPTDAARVILGTTATQEQYEALREQLGLNQPLIVQYGNYLARVFSGDFGTSIFTGEPVIRSIANRLPVTLSLLIPGIIVCAVAGMTFGYLSALSRGGLRRVLDVLVLVGGAVPGFWLALVMVSVFAVSLRWFPATGYVPFATSPGGWATALVLPVAALAIQGAAGVAKITRDRVLEAMDQDYVRTLRAAGIPRRTIYLRHILKNTGMQVATVVGLIFVGSLAGSVFLEQVFVLPGLGALAYSATNQNDLPVIQGVALTMTLIVIVVNICVDLSYLALNPKARTR